MIPALGIYRSANVLVKQHGPDAPIQAAMRADAMLDKGDLDGYTVWKRIVKAAGELLSKERPDGATVSPRGRRALDPCAFSTIYMVGIRFGY